jgi:phosphate transport system substrate-binding protein
MQIAMIRPAVCRTDRTLAARRQAVVGVLLGALVGLTSLQSVAADGLKISGTGAVTAALRALAPAFASQTGIGVEVVANLGTTGANNAIVDGKLDLAVGGRDLQDRERARGLQVLGVVSTPFGFVTSRAGPDEFAKSGIVGLYRAADPTWPDGMPMLIALRPVEEIDNEILAALFPGLDDVLMQMRKRGDISIAATNRDNADLAERTKGSLVAATLAQIKAERRNLRFVAIDGVAPSVQAYLDGSYPYGKTLYLVGPSRPSAEARAFVEFLANPTTRPQLAELGLTAGVR